MHGVADSRSSVCVCVCVGRMEEGAAEGGLRRLLLPRERRRHGAIFRLQRHKERHEIAAIFVFLSHCRCRKAEISITKGPASRRRFPVEWKG